MLRLWSAFRSLWLAAACAACMPAHGSTPDAAEPVEPWRQWRSVLFRVLPPVAAAADSAQAASAAASDTSGGPGSSAGSHGSGGAADFPSPDGSPPAPVNFLFGTIHFGELEELDLDTDVLREAMRHTRVLVNEVDGATRWDADKERYRLLPDPSGLPALIGQPAFAELTRLLPQVAPPLLRRLKPWAALALLEARGEVAGEQTLDRRIEHWAAVLDMRTEHLETLDEQLAALDCVPSSEQALVLQQRLRTPWLFGEQSARVLDYYRSRNLAAWLDEIDAMVGLDARARPIEERARHCLIEARNERWLPKLENLLRHGGAFVAVGAIHLTGSAGLLERLRRRGFLIVAEPM